MHCRLESGFCLLDISSSVTNFTIVCLPTEQVYHVSVPTQPSAQVGEGIIKLSSPNSASVISPTTGKPIMEIPFRDIRRLGCCATFNLSLVWFETCRSCKGGQPDQFYFFVVSSGIGNAQIITRELKTAIERFTGVFLIMESDQAELAFISRNHYGCPPYPAMAKTNIIRRALGHFPVPYMPHPPTIRRESDPAMAVGVSLEEYAAAKPSRRTFSLSSGSTPKPRVLMKSHTTLDRFRKPSSSSISSQNSLELETGGEPSTPNSDVFDTSSYSPKRKLSLSQKDSLSSHSSTNSGPYNPAIAEEEENEVDDVVEEDDGIAGRTNMSNMHRLTRSGTDLHTIGRPNVPPRSRASLLPNLKKRSKTVYGI